MERKILTTLFISLAFTMAAQDMPIYLDDTQPLEARVEDALSRMTLEEKIAVIHAQSKFSSPGVKRLGIPENWMTDGPHGIRAEVLWDEWYWADWTNDSCTAFPALTALAATWNPEMARLYGKSIGEEARYRNKNVLLGPGVNIYRTPLNGRNFEYMGEDPYLASQMVVPYVQGVQSNGVAACLKHFALNNQERDRHVVDVTVDERALYEIYLPAFKTAVIEGGAWAIMPGYNKWNGSYACENRRLLTDILKNEWGFDGVAISDWGAVHDTQSVATSGLDMEFGTWTNGLDWGESNAYDNYHLARRYLEGIKDGNYSMEDLDDKVRRVLRLSMRTTMNRHRPYGSFATEEHALASREIASEGIVLLKNDSAKDIGYPVLPIDLSGVKNILVVGENADKMMTLGGGSSQLKTFREITPLQGIRRISGKDINVEYCKGYESESVAEQDRKDAITPESKDIDYDALRQESIKAAQQADVVIFVGGLNKNPGQDCEGEDRNDYALPYQQNELIEALAAVNKNLVVVLLSGNAMAMPWEEKVSAIVMGWYCGSEAGTALADVLFGNVNPSGKLPFTIAARLEDYAPHARNDSLSYPGVENKVVYKEGIDIGYRHADRIENLPLFPFGHGLSYTEFKYDKVKASLSSNNQSLVKVDVRVTNVGEDYGKEVVQIYVSPRGSKVYRPIKELKGFKKVALSPGESENISIELPASAFSYYDASIKEWICEPGEYDILVGSSSKDIRAKTQISVPQI